MAPAKIPGLPRLRRFLPRSRGVLLATLAIAALLLAGRLLAPGLIRDAVVRRLNRVPDYSGRVGAVRLQVWRGAYTIKEIRIVKSNGRVQEPFFTADRLDFSVAWRDVIHGRLVSEVLITNARLNLLRGPTDETSELEIDRRWQSAIQDIFPIQINHLQVRGGVLRFIDLTSRPKIDVAIHGLELEATGLRNRPAQNGAKYPAQITVFGETVGNGHLRLIAQLEPLAVQPAFELSVELKEVSLPGLNDLLRAYASLDVSQGRLEVLGQIAMRDGHYEGFVNPFLDQLNFSDFTGGKKTLGQRVWKSLVAAAINLTKNKNSRKFATRIPFAGDGGRMDAQTWRSIENALQLGFVAALPAGFEGTTHPDDKESKLPVAPKVSISAPAKPGG